MKSIKRISLIHFFSLVLIILSSCNVIENDILIKPEKYDYVNLNEISIEKIDKSLNLAAQWLLKNQNEDGSLRYLYFPSTQKYSTGNNMIRQFMSTIAIAEMHKYTNDKKYKEAYDKNLKFNFENYYFEDINVGYIFYANKSKLGAAAFALISTIEDKENKYINQKNKLTNLILLLHNENDGSFRTFYVPEERNDNQNFYPGEAMLALMMLYEETGDKIYLDAVKKSFEFYSDWHRNNKNPAFVPWHTMTLYRLYQIDSNEEYADFIFEMNDFLIEIQNKNCSEPKHLGRFYDSEKSYYGPPHASSTAVYTEGLVYAYNLAKILDDKGRMEKYKEAIILGSRSLIELQFKEEDIVNRNDARIVLGGIRTSTDRDEIRVDNNQHSIMAFIQILNSLNNEEIKDFVDKNPQYICS